MAHKTHPYTLSTIRIVGLSIFALFVYIARPFNFLEITWQIWALSAIGAAAGVVVSKYFLYKSYRYLEYSRIAILRIWQPVCVLIIGVLVFNEVIPDYKWLGIGIVFLGTLLLGTKNFQLKRLRKLFKRKEEEKNIATWEEL